MKHSIGIDIVDVDDFRKKLLRTKSIKNRLFTDHEIEYCKNKGVESLAVRFAAKEAFKKAADLQNLNWHDVEVRNLPSGKPILSINKKIKNKLKIKSAKISLSHTKKQAIAVVLLGRS